MRQSWRVRLRSRCQPNLGTSDSPLLPVERECLCGSGAAPLFHYVEVAWAGVLWVIISSLVSSLTTFLVYPPQGKKSCQMRNKILQSAEAHPKSLKHPTTWTVCTHFQKLETQNLQRRQLLGLQKQHLTKHSRRILLSPQLMALPHSSAPMC